MSDIERFEQRLAAVERAVVDGDFELSELGNVASIAADVERLESRLDDLERRLAEVEGAAQSFGGYVARVDSVNERVEQRADTAIATVDRLERRIDELERTIDGRSGGRSDGTERRSVAGRSSVDGVHAARATADDDPRTPADPVDADRAIDALLDGSERDGQRSRSAAPSPQSADGEAGTGRSSGWSPVADQQTVEETVSSTSEAETADGDGAESEDEEGGTTLSYAGLGLRLGSGDDERGTGDSNADGGDDGSGAGSDTGTGDGDDTGDSTILATIRSKFT